MTETAFTITDRKRDYSPLGLNANPFPYSPVPADDPKIYCGQDHATEAVSETISTVLRTGKSKHLVITGTYGNGKSHTLKYTRSLVRGRSDVVVGYVAQPGEGFVDIYHEFMYDIGFESIQDLSYEFLISITKEQTENNPGDTEEMKQLIDNGDVLLSEIVPPAVKRLSELTRFADFARALIHMIYQDTNLYAWQWLTSEGIRYEQRKQMEIHAGLDDDTMAVRAFTSLKRVLLELGYKSVFVFVDEFESIARLSPKEEQSALNSIRHLMDQNSQGLCLLFGCAPEVWQEVMSEYHAFSERIGQEVALRPLTDEDVAHLITRYLDLERTSDEGGTWPFDPKCVEFVHKRSQGNVRQVLSFCSRLLDAGVDEGKEELTADFAERTLTN